MEPFQNPQLPIKETESTSSAQISVNGHIIPFTESPSSHQYDDHTKTDGELRACDLFSFFTADIIQLDVTFTR